MTLLAMKREYMAVLTRRLELEKENGIALYEPQPKQDKFHRAGTYFRRMFRGGNRTGKSTVGVAEDVCWALGFRPFYEENDPARYAGIPKRSVKILVIAADWDKVHDIFTNQVEGQHQGKFWKFLPKASLLPDSIKKNQSGHVESIKVKSHWGGESLIVFDTVKSFLSNRLGQESSMFDAIHVDEPIPHDMWVANSRGLVDNGGFAWFTLTPIGSETWIDDMFFPEGEQRGDKKDEFVMVKMVGDVRLEFWSITGTMYDNKYNREQDIAAFMADLSTEEKEARIYGRPQLYAGVIYREFTEDHIYHDCPIGWNDYDDPPRDYCIRIAIDTHPRTPHATLFAATSPNGYVFFWNELFENGQIHEYVTRIFTLLNGRMPHRSFLELQAYNPNPAGDGTTIADDFYSSGLRVEKAPRDLMFGIMKVKDELSKRDKQGRPYYYFSPKLRETIREFGRYVWDPDTNKPVDKNDHMMENLYRLMISGLEYVEPTEQPRGIIPMMDLDHPAEFLPSIHDIRLTEFDAKKPERRKVPPAFCPNPMMRQNWHPLDADWRTPTYFQKK